MKPSLLQPDSRRVRPDAECKSLARSGYRYLVTWNMSDALRCFEKAADRCISWYVPHDGLAAVRWLQGDKQQASTSMVSALEASLADQITDLPKRLRVLTWMPLSTSHYKRVIRVVKRKLQSLEEKNTLPASYNARLFYDPDAQLARDIRRSLAGFQFAHRDFAAANTGFERLLELGVGTRDFHQYFLLAATYALLGKKPEAWAVFRRGMRLTDYNSSLYVALGSWGHLIDTPPTHCRQVLSLIESFEHGPSNLSLGLALMHYYCGSFSRSASHAEQALDVLETSCDRKLKIVIKAFCELTKGCAACERGQWDSALTAFDKGEALCESIAMSCPYVSSHAFKHARLWMVDTQIRTVLHGYLSGRHLDALTPIARDAANQLRATLSQYAVGESLTRGTLPVWATVPVICRVAILEALCDGDAPTSRDRWQQITADTQRVRSMVVLSRLFLSPCVTVTHLRDEIVATPSRHTRNPQSGARGMVRQSLLHLCNTLAASFDDSGVSGRPVGYLDSQLDWFWCAGLELLADYHIGRHCTPLSRWLKHAQIKQLMMDNFWVHSASVRAELAAFLGGGSPHSVAVTIDAGRLHTSNRRRSTCESD